MQAYRILSGAGIQGLERFARPLPALRAHDVHLRVRAVSLNYRDLMIARGDYLTTNGEPRVPCSDGAGEIVATGDAVTRWRAGDRVTGAFFPKWIDGAPNAEKTADSLGGSVDGMLSEELQLHEDALTAIPEHLDFVQAATLPCAAVTAWNALFVEGRAMPGKSVLLLGTGGVSIWALQLAKAAGLRVFITSSSDEKLDKARSLGADGTVNYRATPNWHDEVKLKFTEGRGVDLVLEVGGKDTMSGSLAAAAMGATVAVIGGVSGFGGAFEPLQLIGGAKRLAGIYVGNRTMMEDLGRFVQTSRIAPVVDRVFGFGQAREAYEHLAAANHFGKVVVEIDGAS